MSGALKGSTKNYAFNKVNFDFPRWHTYEWQNWDLVDAALYSIGGISSSGLWQNSTDYIEGIRVTDDEDSVTYTALISHRSPDTGTFKNYRDAFPGQWRPITAVPYYRGEFIYPATYYAGDIAKKGYVYKLATAFSNSTVDSFVDGAYWVTVFDATETIAAIDAGRIYAETMQAQYEDFLSRYLGAYSANPLTDSLGNDLQVGALYWNTAFNLFRVHRGSDVWDEMIDEAPQDGQQYARQNGVWQQVIAGAQVGPDAPLSPLRNSFWWDSDNGSLFIRYWDGNSEQWVQVGGGGGGGGGISLDAVLKTGDTMTGPLVLPGNPTANLEAAPKQYVDAQIAAIPQPVVYTQSQSDARFMNVTGDTATGRIDAPNFAALAPAGWAHIYIGKDITNTNWYVQHNPDNNYLTVNSRVGGAAVTTPAMFAPNGDLYLGIYSGWISNVIAGKASLGSEPLFGNSLTLAGGSPTMRFKHATDYNAWLHCNQNLFYVLRSLPAAGIWDSGPNGRHPMTMNLSTGDVTFSGNVGAYSDERMKKNVRPVTNALEAVLQMEGVWFNKIETGEEGAGVIAQKLQKIAPELVREDKDGYLSVDYGNMAAYFIEAIKELAKR